MGDMCSDGQAGGRSRRWGVEHVQHVASTAEEKVIHEATILGHGLGSHP